MNVTNNSLRTISPGNIGPIHKIEDNVFTAEAIAPTGEKIYFAMEPMGDGNEWLDYRTRTNKLVMGGNYFTSFGSLTEIGFCINDTDELKKYLEKQSDPEFWTHDKPRFEELSAKLKERKITMGSAKAKELMTIPQAANGMKFDSQTHVVYISKTPITGKANFDISSSDRPCFGDYVNRYGNLIMSVGVKIDEIVENRGIFKNPWCVVSGGYGGIAMMAHSFTCMVVKEHWLSVKTFKVRPLKIMGEIFMNSVPKHLFTVSGIRADQYDEGFDQEHDVLVPVEVLADLHRVK